MTITIEFIRTRSPIFARVLSIARTISTFKERDSDGITLYSVAFEEQEYESAQAFLDHIRGWKGVAFYIDGKVVSKATASRRVFDKIALNAARETRRSNQFGDTPSDFVSIQKRPRIEGNSLRNIFTNEPPPPNN